MSDTHTFALRQLDRATSKFAALDDDHDFAQTQFGPSTIRREVGQIILGILFAAALLVASWAEMFWRL